MTDDERWERDGLDFGWTLPKKAARWKRLPVIRHIRVYWNAFWIEQHYRHGPGRLGLRSGYDSWALYAMWRGWC